MPGGTKREIYVDTDLLRKVKPVLVAAGHSETDPGAAANGFSEVALVVPLRNRIAEILRAEGVEVITDGEEETNLPLSEATKLVPTVGIALELHFNAAGAAAKGVEALSLPAQRELSQDIAGAIASVTGSPLRGDKGYKPDTESARGRLGFARAGGVVVEVEFLTNKSALAVYLQNKEEVAQAIARAVMKHV